jgi:hypothetical protein
MNSDPNEALSFLTLKGLWIRRRLERKQDPSFNLNTHNARRDWASPVPAMITSHGCSDNDSIISSTKAAV